MFHLVILLGSIFLLLILMAISLKGKTDKQAQNFHTFPEMCSKIKVKYFLTIMQPRLR